MDARTGEAFESNLQLTVVGRKLKLFHKAPDFELEYLDPRDRQLHTLKLADSAGKVRVLSVINSIDTPVCHVETCHWEKLRHELPVNAVVYTVSMDLPFALARWQAAENIHHQLLSAHQGEQFGRDYGVLLKEWRLLQRAVFVIDRGDHVVHADYVADQLHEPDYLAALAVARRAGGSG